MSEIRVGTELGNDVIVQPRSAHANRAETDALVRDFARRVEALPQVYQVLLDESGAFARIWTVIRGEPFDPSLREPVYSAELASLDANPQASLNFRLVNLDEFPDTDATALIPQEASVVWSRG